MKGINLILCILLLVFGVTMMRVCELTDASAQGLEPPPFPVVVPNGFAVPDISTRLAADAPTTANMETIYAATAQMRSARNGMQFSINLVCEGKVIEARNAIFQAVLLLDDHFNMVFDTAIARMETTGAIRLSGPLRADKAALLSDALELQKIIYGANVETPEITLSKLLDYRDGVYQPEVTE